MRIQRIIEFQLKGYGPPSHTCTPTTSAGHCKFFLSPQLRNRISIFLIRNCKSAIAR